MLRHRGTCDETPSSDERRHQAARENGSTYVHQSGAHPMTQKQIERRPSGERGNPQRGPAMTGPVPIRRTTEIEEITNLYFIHPLASRLVPFFARMRFTPNAVSVTGMLFGILSALAYYRYSDVRFAITGFALMIAWHVMDGADGQLA